MYSTCLAYSPDSVEQRAQTLAICWDYLHTGYVANGRMFNRIGGKLKSLRMTQLSGNAEEPEVEKYAQILEKTLIKFYDLNTLLYLSRKSKRTLGLGGVLKKGGFAVLVGSKCSVLNEKSLRVIHKNRRSQLLTEGITYDNGISMWLKKSIRFDSPTAAANFVTGSPVSGMLYWKTWAGKQLKHL